MLLHDAKERGSFMSNKIKAVLFDLDGVLFDTEYISAVNVIKKAETLGLHLDFNAVVNTAGMAHDQARLIFDDLLKEVGGHDEFERKTAHLPKEEMPFRDIKIPYVDELLSYLKSKGYKMAVCSSSPMDYISRALQEGKIEDYFDYVITGYDLPVGKPDPAIYLKAMKELEVTPEEAVIIEDAYYGIESGKRAGCFVIARHDPKYSYDQSRADMLVEDYRDLINDDIL